MHSNTPKVLHLLAGQPLIRYSLQAAAGIGTEMPVVVIGHASEQVRQVVGKMPALCCKNLSLAPVMQLAQQNPCWQVKLTWCW